MPSFFAFSANGTNRQFINGSPTTLNVLASLGGAARNPVWYHNLKKNPQVELQDGPSSGDYTAREVSGAEKATWWERAAAVWPDYRRYQTKTDREIPVFVLEPLAGPGRRG